MPRKNPGFCERCENTCGRSCTTISRSSMLSTNDVLDSHALISALRSLARLGRGQPSPPILLAQRRSYRFRRSFLNLPLSRCPGTINRPLSLSLAESLLRRAPASSRSAWLSPRSSRIPLRAQPIPGRPIPRRAGIEGRGPDGRLGSLVPRSQCLIASLQAMGSRPLLLPHEAPAHVLCAPATAFTSRSSDPARSSSAKNDAA